MSSVERESRDGYSEIFNRGEKWRSGLENLTAILHYYEVLNSLGEMDTAVIDETVQGELVARVASSLQRYCEIPACCHMIGSVLIHHHSE